MQNGSSRGPRDDIIHPNTILENTGETTLQKAASLGDEKLLNSLLASGADRNAKDLKHGNTPLHEAAWRGYSRCVKALCALPQSKIGKDVKESKVKGALQETRGALHSALLGARNNGGFSALHLAAQNGHNQSCREILLAGADPDVQNNYGDSPLHTACRYGHAGATRILLSAKCDPNRTNLNGDTPLHIACAMGRRKLTKILLEAESNIEIRNSQNETPKDIAIRKNLPEIINILDKPIITKTAKNREKINKKGNNDKVDGVKIQGVKKKNTTNPATWSPYGCHYFPDPRSFPSPKLETLPKEPLEKGEQYYLDLAGNIRKGPIGVGNTCYCGPFFRHIEERISKNRKSIRKYVHKATERLGSKVDELATRTDDQIEQLTRSMIADRIRCEGRQLHLQQWLKRGDYSRYTVGHNSKTKKNIDNTNTISRCRSLELLDDDNLENRTVQNSKSFDMLDETDAIIHRTPESKKSSTLTEKRSKRQSSEQSRSTTEHDAYSVSERLEELLTKTNEILEIEKSVRWKYKDSISSSELNGRQEKKPRHNEKYKPISSLHRHSMYDENIIQQLKQTCLNANNSQQRSYNQSQSIEHEMSKITTSLLRLDVRTSSKSSLSPEISKDVTSQKELDRKSEQEHERSSILSGSSHKNPSSMGELNTPESSQYNENKLKLSNTLGIPDYNCGYQNAVKNYEINSEQKYTNSISTIRNQNPIPAVTMSPQNLHKDEEFSYINKFSNGFPHDSIYTELAGNYSKTVASEKSFIDPDDITELSEMANINEINELKSRILNGSHCRNQNNKKNYQQIINSTDINYATNGLIHKPEIKNSEVKTLRTPSLGQQRRNKVKELVAKIQGNPQKIQEENSESSEDERDETVICQTNSTNNPAINIDSRVFIPKDAYFHELPDKNRLKTMNNQINDNHIEQTKSSNILLAARTRNPLPYVNDYDINLKSNQIIKNDESTCSKYIRQREKLLVNRKHVVPPINNNNFDLLRQTPINFSTLHQEIILTAEQAQADRDANNDSGYSTKVYESSHGPSPSLSGQSDFGHVVHRNEIHEIIVHNDEANNCIPYFMANVGASSLV